MIGRCKNEHHLLDNGNKNLTCLVDDKQQQ